MDIDVAIAGYRDAKDKLRTKEGTTDPLVISEQMYRLSQYIGALEDHLAELEYGYEIAYGKAFHAYLKDKSANASEMLVKADMASFKAEIARLSRMVSSGWKIVGSSQSRFNHLQTEAGLGRHTV